jgi:hypothetical protein
MESYLPTSTWVAGAVYLVHPWTKLNNMMPSLQRLAAARAFWVTLGFAGFVLLLNLLKPQPLPGICVVGDTRARLAAHVPEALRHTQLDAEHIGIGLGSAAIGGWEGLGDALVISGQVYVASTRHNATVVFQTLDRPFPARSLSAIPGLVESDRFFQTSNLVYVPLAARARASLRVEPGITLDALWRQLAARYPGGVLVAGTVQWQRLRRYAMTRPPIDGLSIFAHTTHYYTQPMENHQDVRGYLAGIAAHPRIMPSGNVLYANLFARRPDGNLDLPAHVLVLKTMPADPARAPTAEEAVSVGRAASDSLLAGGLLALYPLENIMACEDAFVPMTSAVPEMPQQLLLALPK